MSVIIKAGGELLYDRRLIDLGYDLHGAKIAEKLNKSGSLTLLVPRSNPRYNSFVPLHTVVEVRRGDKLRWRGRSLVPGRDYFGRKSITCEGELSFLQDSVQRPRSVTGTPEVIFRDLIEAHNARVEPWKRFAVGFVTVTAKADLTLEADGKSKTFAIVGKLVRSCGGYLIIDDADDGSRRINWYKTLPYTCNQVVRAGYNLADFSSSGTVSGFATRIVPYGAKGEDGTRLRLDLDGVDYVENADAVAQFGVVEMSIVYDDISAAEELRSRAEADLVRACVIPETMTLTAYDMASQSLAVDRFAMGQRVRAESEAHGLSDTYDLLSLSEDLLDPEAGEITLTRDAAYVDTSAGTLSGSVSDQQAQLADSESGFAQLVKTASDWLTSGTGYMVIRCHTDGSPMDILFMDTRDMETAQYVLRIGSTGIGFSKTGVQGPYISAWTLDGRFNADSINLTGKFATYSTDGVQGGWLGYLEGSTGSSVTTGIGMSDVLGLCYAIATGAGVRLQAGDVMLYLTKDNGEIVLIGKTVVNGPLTINGDVIITGTLTLNGVEIIAPEEEPDPGTETGENTESEEVI